MKTIAKKEEYIHKLNTFILWSMAVYYFFVISLFSSQPAQVSASESRTIVEKSIQVVNNLVTVVSGNETPKLPRTTITSIVRKSAHMFNFTILGFLYCMTAYRTQWRSRILVLLTAMLCGLLGAIVDELHQLFVEGRSAQISDIMIDFTGVSIGCMLFTLSRYFIFKDKLVFLEGSKL